jgi:antitoxin (DNA-binding transcriptional repressor) of toxin-antitoxin stability system
VNRLTILFSNPLGTQVVRFVQSPIVSERGVPVATIIPFEPAHKAMPFANRKAVRGFEELPAIEHDSTEYISADRDRA